MDIGNRLKDFGLRRSLQQIAAGSGQQGVEYLVAVLIDGQHQDLRGGDEGFELADTLDAVHLRQIDVHQDDIRGLGRELRDGFLAGPVSATTHEALCLANTGREILANPSVDRKSTRLNSSHLGISY